MNSYKQQVVDQVIKCLSPGFSHSYGRPTHVAIEGHGTIFLREGYNFPLIVDLVELRSILEGSTGLVDIRCLFQSGYEVSLYQYSLMPIAYQAQSARDVQASHTKSYCDYLEQSALEQAGRFPEKATEILTRPFNQLNFQHNVHGVS